MWWKPASPGSNPPGPMLPAIRSCPRHFAIPRFGMGSRFGSRQTRGMFYGSRCRSGSLVEGAYYALLFWEGLIDPPRHRFSGGRRCFSVVIQTRRGLQLQAIAECGHPGRPPRSDSLRVHAASGGMDSRSGVEVFEYLSARSSEALVQVGVFTPSVFQSPPLIRWTSPAEVTAEPHFILCHDDQRAASLTRVRGF